MGLVANFNAFQQCKNFENQLRFDKVTEGLKVGTFLRHSVYLIDGATGAVLNQLSPFWH